jgi:hypothetical protein
MKSRRGSDPALGSLGDADSGDFGGLLESFSMIRWVLGMRKDGVWQR